MNGCGDKRLRTCNNRPTGKSSGEDVSPAIAPARVGAKKLNRAIVSGVELAGRSLRIIKQKIVEASSAEVRGQVLVPALAPSRVTAKQLKVRIVDRIEFPNSRGGNVEEQIGQAVPAKLPGNDQIP